MNRSEGIPPTQPFQTETGYWTYYVYPGGVESEAGQFATETDAVRNHGIGLKHYQANGNAYGGDVHTFVSQGPTGVLED